MNAPEARTGSAGIPRWGMVVDLNRCVGCQTCTAACKHANDTPPGVQWRRVLDIEQGRFPDVERLFLVVGCQHCADPPCVPVCPTGATRQRADGLVTMNYDVCIGCAYCAVSCPYQARTIVHESAGYFQAGLTPQERSTAHPERRGVAQKCTFCQERVDTGLARGLVPGVDPEATPACAAACIASAIQFGDFADPSSNVSRLAASRPTLQMHAELGTHPQIRYLYSTSAVPGRQAGADDSDEERLADPANPLVGPLQRYWDWRAALNWCFGGVSSGLAVLAWLAWAGGGLRAIELRGLLLAAAILMAIGLFFVFLKIGRRMRFLRAALRPQSSWMTREIYAAGVFYLAVLASLLRPEPGWAGLAAGAALVFLICQAKILHRARGIPAWRLPAVPWLIVVSGLLEGAGAMLIAAAVSGAAAGNPAFALADGAAGGWLGLVAALAVAQGLLWRIYLASAARGAVPLARRVLAGVTPALHAAGHLAPVVLLAAALFAGGPAARALAALAGVAAIAGGAWWKFSLIGRAGYFQGFALPVLPQRGSGRHAAPARFQAPARV